MVHVERAALRLVGDVNGLLEIDEFRAGLLEALREAVPADWASLNEVGERPEDTFSIVEPPLHQSVHEGWARHSRQNPLVANVERTRDARVLRMSDLVSPAELHALDLYREVYQPIGLEHQIAFSLPVRSTAILGVVLSRRERDFSDTERDLLELARPHLIQAYNNARRYSRLLQAGSPAALGSSPTPSELLARGLTRREAQVLSLAARDSNDREIAAVLEISHRTVQKHLQRCYAKLGAHDRAEAVALAAGAPNPGAGAAPGNGAPGAEASFPAGASSLAEMPSSCT